MKTIVLLGEKIEHSFSPLIHNTAFKELGLDSDYEYRLLSVSKNELAEMVQEIADGHLEGANVTIPYKTHIMKYLSDFDSEAKKIGAVNTLYRQGSRVVGCNTDIQGFVKVLAKTGIQIRGLRVGVVGAGGAARAVVHALANQEVEELCLFNRTLSKATQLADDTRQLLSAELSVRNYPIRTPLDHLDFFVNCTPIGMQGHSLGKTPVNKEFLHERLTVVDLVYNPLKTRLLQDAEEVGCTTIHGAHLLVHQGAISFEKWTGISPPIAVMNRELLQALRGGLP